MMKLFFILLLTCSFLNSFSQDNEEIKTIFGNNVEKISGFGGSFMRFSRVNNDFAHVTGGGAAFVLNDNYYFGIYGTAMTNGVKISSENIDYANAKIKFETSGLFYGYIIAPMKPVHISTGLRTGYGEIAFIDDVRLVEDRVFSIAPTVEMEFNVTTFFRFGIGISYSQVLGVDKLEG